MANAADRPVSHLLAQDDPKASPGGVLSRQSRSNPAARERAPPSKEKDICHVETIAFSPDSKTAAIGGDGWIYFVDVERATIFTQVPVKGVLSLAFSPDGKTIAAGCEDKTVKLFRATKPKTDDEIYGK